MTDEEVSVKHMSRYGQTGRKYLKGPDGLKQREEAILDQLARLERYGTVSERTRAWCERQWWVLTIRSCDELLRNVCGNDGLTGDLGRWRLIVQV